MTTTALAPMKGFTFGCDPELFVVDDTGKFVCADGLIPGTKSDPYPVECGAVQVDGMAAEFNTNPASTFEEFDNNIVTVLRQLKAMLPKGYSLSPVPSAVFDEDVWGAAPDQAKMLGCSPDFNAWTGSVNPPPNDPDNPRLRTASGHLHIGWTSGADVHNPQHINHGHDLTKQLDWYLGAWSLQKDTDATRRRLYGKAGSCRIKDYGVEYRVLSNFWLGSKDLRRQVWNRMNKAIWDMRKYYFPVKAGSYTNTLLIDSINTSVLPQVLCSEFRFPILRI